MRVDDMFDSKYLKADDVPPRKRRPCVIEGVNLEQVGRGESARDRLVVYLVGEEKGLPLNKVNFTSLKEAFGGETNDWRGQKVELYRSTTMFNGKTTPCLRLDALESTPEEVAAAIAAAETAADEAASAPKRGGKRRE